jgi:G3E family GTPase
VGFADQIFLSKTDLVSAEETDALIHRLKHMNPRAPIKAVHFGEVPLKEVLDLRGFNLNAKLDIDPDFLKEEDETATATTTTIITTMTTRRASSATTPRTSTATKATVTTTITTMTSRALFTAPTARSIRPSWRTFWVPSSTSMARACCATRACLNMQGTDRKVIFQGVHQLMGSDLGPQWAEGEARTSKMVFIGIDLPKDIFLQGLEQSLV